MSGETGKNGEPEDILSLALSKLSEAKKKKSPTFLDDSIQGLQTPQLLNLVEAIDVRENALKPGETLPPDLGVIRDIALSKANDHITLDEVTGRTPIIRRN